MESITKFICSLIEPFVTTKGVKVIESPKIIAKGKMPKKTDDFSVRNSGFIADSIWNFLNCSSSTPPTSEYCVDNSDCSVGQRCKEGECLTDPTHCANSGCDEHYECDVESGVCEFVPECTSHLECDQLVAGELCLDRVCKVPPLCTPNLGPTLGCAAGWTCVGNECTKVDCSSITVGNEDVCCKTSLAFDQNETKCCAFDPLLPGC